MPEKKNKGSISVHYIAHHQNTSCFTFKSKAGRLQLLHR